MRDALKALIEGRNRLQVFIEKNLDRQMLAQLRLFDRMQAQKLRRPKSDEEEAEQLIERLQALADSEDFVYDTLAGIIDPESRAGAESSAAGSSAPDAKQAEKSADNEKAAADKHDKGKVNSEPNGDKPGDKPSDEPPGEPMPGTAEESQTPNGSRAGRGDELRDLEDRQLDVALKARELEKTLGKMKNATDLAKQRMAAAAKLAEDGAGALDRGALQEARAAAGSAEKLLRELADQVKALLAKEQADRLAAAQQMAADLARQQDEFQDRLAEADSAGGAGPRRQEPPQEPCKEKDGKPVGKSDDALASDAERIAEKSKSLADVLGVAAHADDPANQDSAKKVEALIGSLDLEALADRLAELPELVRNDKLADARASTGDGAERMEAAAEQLAALVREIVAPRIDELAKLEEKLTALDERLDELETDARITDWHIDADGLLEELDEAGVDRELREALSDEMRQAGWGADLRLGWRWNRIDGGYYAAPAGYRRLLSRLAASLRAQMQELMLGDLRSSGDEPIPPQYQDLVDRYYQVLASDRGARPQRANEKAGK